MIKLSNLYKLKDKNSCINMFPIINHSLFKCFLINFILPFYTTDNAYIIICIVTTNSKLFNLYHVIFKLER